MSDQLDPPRRLLREWAVCGIAAAAARFIPVPLLDDVVKERATRIAIVRTLKAHGRAYPSDAVEPLYGDIDGWAAGAARKVAAVPGKIVLFPVRKYVAVFGAVKGVPTDLMRVILLARTVHRCLQQGRLPDADRKALRAEAVMVRRAFDAALQHMDLRLLTGALSDGLSHGRGLTAAATRYARQAFDRDDADPGLDPGGSVAEGAETVEGVLRRPEIVALLAEFDSRVDAALAGTPFLPVDLTR